jgi:2-oxoglutarate dehydrogenase E2 component (dihydrolipoamide succinyltransferase)
MLALLPASAAAQSAGDEQYEDPFGEEQSQETPTATPAPAQPAEPAQSAPAQPAPAQPAPAPAAAPAQAAQLPRTGSDAALPGVLGLILLAAGVALRAHVRRAP